MIKATLFLVYPDDEDADTEVSFRLWPGYGFKFASEANQWFKELYDAAKPDEEIKLIDSDGEVWGFFPQTISSVTMVDSNK